MTDALKQWAWEQSAKAKLEDYEQSHALSPMAAEFWIRAFCGEVKGLSDDGYGTVEERLYDAFRELKRELLGKDG